MDFKQKKAKSYIKGAFIFLNIKNIRQQSFAFTPGRIKSPLFHHENVPDVR